MAKKYWFKPKRYGYGFFPISWEGWLAILFLLVLIFISASTNRIFEVEATIRDGLRFLLDIIILSSIATLLFEKKMEEPLKWRWGRWRK